MIGGEEVPGYGSEKTWKFPVQKMMSSSGNGSCVRMPSFVTVASACAAECLETPLIPAEACSTRSSLRPK